MFVFVMALVKMQFCLTKVAWSCTSMAFGEQCVMITGNLPITEMKMLWLYVGCLAIRKSIEPPVLYIAIQLVSMR